MSFFDSNKPIYNKINYFDLSYGSHKIRLLPEPKTIFVHYIPSSKVSIRCLGNECPICENNKLIKMQNPETYRDMPEYLGASKRFFVNVLDKTLVKVCPFCGKENKKDLMNKYPPVCTVCSSFITDVQETVSNKVKIINFSESIANQINSFDASILDSDGTPLGVTNFDLVLLVTPLGKKRQLSVIQDQDPASFEAVDLESLKPFMYNLDNAVIKLSREEIVLLLGGTSLRDIFIARNKPKSDMVEDENVANV